MRKGCCATPLLSFSVSYRQVVGISGLRAFASLPCSYKQTNGVALCSNNMYTWKKILKRVETGSKIRYLSVCVLSSP